MNRAACAAIFLGLFTIAGGWLVLRAEDSIPAQNTEGHTRVVFVAAKPAKGKGSDDLSWSFKPLAKPTPPAVKNTAWARNDLDRFILTRLETAGLKPNPDADRPTLLRRTAFDLTGLPPSEKELAAFMRDPASDDEAFARVVDRYLASSRFGERWGRHWLDVVRYADSVGRTFNPPFTYAWRYRDYVIDALNKDKPYDRFITEQLAGDLLPARTVAEQRENLTATGFLAIGSHDLQGSNREQFTLDCIDDQIDVITRTMMGLTINCARCHDHKYDPVSMRDYYALAGIFYSTRILPGVSWYGRGNGYVDHEKLVVLPVAQGNRIVKPAIVPGVHSMDDYNEIWRQGKRDIRYTTDPNLAMGVSEDEIEDCAIRLKGDPADLGPVPPRGDLQIAGLPPLPKVAKGASGRLELARWMTSPDHPLTARVMANRIWLHLFGRGLVAAADDFGVMSEPPSHPELLDHLARQFISDGWSTKRLIRSIMLSRTYRQSSAGNSASQARDAENNLYWRMNLRRLEVEAIRDAILMSAGELRDDRPEGIQVTGIGGKSRLSTVHSLLDIDAPYRTIYLPVLRSYLPALYDTFDFPDPCQIKGQREVTTVAPQALFLLNSDFVMSCARDAAEKLVADVGNKDADAVRLAYQRLLGRSPEKEEIAAALALMAGVQPPSSTRDGDSYRWSVFVQALMACAEFRYLQ
jgi:hypothetical protein